MSKFSLTPNPTFESLIEFPIAGGGTAKFKVEYKHKTTKELEDYLKRLGGKIKDIDAAMEIMAGWELKDEFNQENVELLFANYGASARAILGSYVDELMGARQGN